MPTVVVGVGQAGISVINRLHDSDGLGWGEEYDKYFDYIAIDSNSDELWNAPDKATQVDLGDSNAIQAHMQWSKGGKKTDLREYPYLTEDFEISEMGTLRQRPIGRYKLDSGNSYEATVKAITETVEEWAEAVQTSSDLPTELNIVHVHSLGGGTGSGTFPLVASIIDDIVAEVQPEYGIQVYTAGIGISPENYQHLDTTHPPGDPRYYANTYTALKDLNQVIDASPDDPLPLYRYSAFEETLDGTMSDVDALEPQSEITRSPYQDYFLVGVDEERIAYDDRGPESYRDAVNNTITAAIFGIAAELGSKRLYLRGRMRAKRMGWRPRIGSLDQTQLSVPIEDVGTYCDLNERIENLREQVGRDDGEGLLVGRLRDAQRQRAVLKRIVETPAAALRGCEQPDAVDEEVEAALDRTIGSGEAVGKTTPEGIDDLLDTLTERHGEPVGLLALDRGEKRLTAAKQRREADLQELVEDYWQRLEDAEAVETEANTVLEQLKVLREHLRGEVERLERKMDESGRWFLPDLDIIDSGHDYEQQRDTYQQRLAALEEGQATVEAVRETLQAVRTRRDELLETRIEPELNRLEERIDERRREFEEATAELDDLIQDREDKINELTDARYGDRLGRLALDEEKLREDLDRETLDEELTSLSAFHEEEYLAGGLGEQIEWCIGQCYAWDSTLTSWEDDPNRGFGSRAPGIRDVWMLHSDENANLFEFDITGAGQYQLLRSDSSGVFPAFEDPYTIQFLSYTLDSPLSDLQVYAELERAAESGWLDTILDVWDDYRLAFAYPEWYGREIYAGFAEGPIELPMLPELDETEVTVEKDGGELKAWINSHGLASYLWNGDDWDDFNDTITVEGYDYVGWKHYLSEEYGLSYDDMRAAVPNDRTAKLWQAGRITWEELLEEVQENLIERHNIRIKITSD
jgi:hypothetical protein